MSDKPNGKVFGLHLEIDRDYDAWIGALLDFIRETNKESQAHTILLADLFSRFSSDKLSEEEWSKCNLELIETITEAAPEGKIEDIKLIDICESLLDRYDAEGFRAYVASYACETLADIMRKCVERFMGEESEAVRVSKDEWEGTQNGQ